MTLTILEQIAFLAFCVGAVLVIAVLAIVAWADHQSHTRLRHDREEQS